MGMREKEKEGLTPFPRMHNEKVPGCLVIWGVEWVKLNFLNHKPIKLV